MAALSGATPSEFGRALAERRRRARLRRLTGAGVGAALLLLAGLLVYLFWFSPVLTARQTTVSGTQLLSEADVLAAAQVPLGTPLAGIDTAGITSRVAALAPVASVSVRAEYPSTLAIAVTERTAVYQRAVEGGHQWVDGTGVGFHVAGSRQPDLPLAVVGGEDHRLLADVATVVSHLPGELRPRLEQVTAPAVDQVTVELVDGDRVVWGSAEESELKSEVLATLLQVDATVYDVSAPRYPTTK